MQLRYKGTTILRIVQIFPHIYRFPYPSYTRKAHHCAFLLIFNNLYPISGTLPNAITPTRLLRVVLQRYRSKRG